MTVTAERLETYSIAQAQQMLRGVVRQTSVVLDSRVGRGNWLYMKLESEQVGGTFKARGMYMGASALRASGVTEFVLASAGNAAAGAAFSARELGMSGTIVMPTNTPKSKIQLTEKLGGEVVLYGDSFDEADAEANRRTTKHKKRLHAFDGYAQIAGQGTMTAEILEQRPDVDVIFLPVGGGSALAGGLQAIEESGSDARIVAVQLQGNNSMEKSVHAGEITDADAVNALAEGSSVLRVGKHTLEVVMRNLERVEFMTVKPADIGREIVHQDIQRQQLAAALGATAFDYFPETTGLLASAGARRYAEDHPELSEQVFVAAVTGSNSDPEKEQAAVNAWLESKPSLDRL